MCELTYMLIFCLFKSFVPLLRRSGLLTFEFSFITANNLNCIVLKTNHSISFAMPTSQILRTVKDFARL